MARFFPYAIEKSPVLKIQFWVFLFVPSLLFSQVEWATKRRFSQIHSIYDAKVDTIGNHYIFGWMRPENSWDTIRPVGAFVTKTDPDGKMVWMKKLPGSMREGYIDKYNRPVVQNIDHIRILNPVDGAVVKDIELVKRTAFPQVRSFDMDDDGNYLILGKFTTDTVTLGNIQIINRDRTLKYFYAKVDSNGNGIWGKCGGWGHDDYFSEMKLKQKDKSFYIAGRVLDSVKFDNLTLPEDNGNLTFLAKFNQSDGNVKWLKHIGFFNILDMVIANDGSVYIVGNKESGTFSIDGHSATSYGLRDILILKFDSSGVCQWIKNPSDNGDDGGIGIEVDDGGNSYITGVFQGKAHFDEFELTNTGYTEPFVAKLDPLGKTIWAYQPKGSGISYRANLHKDNIYTVGVFNGTMECSGHPIATHPSESDMFIFKMNQTLVSVEHEVKMKAINIYPNPTNGTTSISGLSQYKVKTIEVQDALGKTVFSRSHDGSDMFEFDISKLARGIYFVKVFDDSEGCITIKLIKEG